ncbi:putative methyltransferase TCM_000336 [Tasmannia lanceolata]|uniref:putative methyltransferase TCM_000336 n=1 Tax=Tasmannia lanceolata TaxID=3420 RepID=UPI00406492D0
MDVERVFHMKEGLGETSYAKNSSMQKKVLDMVKHLTMDAILDLYLTQTPQRISIADLGCSSGPNTLSVIREIVGAVDERCCEILQPTPEFQVFLNDLSTNDFNSIFLSLPEFYSKLRKEGRREDSLSVFIAGVPGSFYGRLFPSNSLHFIHSSFSLHWLSQVPLGLFGEDGKPINKGKMYISETSPCKVIDAYFMQFQEDFMLFLKSRSEELVSEGRMVLILLGRRSRDHTDRASAFYWDLLAEAFAGMVSLGEVEQDEVDSYNVHFYAPCMEEIKGIVQREGSFTIECLEIFEIGRNDTNGVRDGKSMAMAVRAIQESLIRHHFGERIIDRLFERYGEILDKELAKEEIKVASLIVVLRKSS